MNIKNSLVLSFLFSILVSYSQNSLYSSFTIPKGLTDNANAVVRSNELHVSIKSVNEMTVFEKRIMTVLNKKGDDAIDAYVHYDNNIKIKTLQALVFNSLGIQIKKIKKDDFNDVSAVDGGTLYSDSRVKYLEYTPISYPYTVEFTCEFTTSNTAFIDSFRPITSYFVSVENSSYTISYTENISVRKKEKNLENILFEKQENAGNITYKVKNIVAMEPEQYSPALVDLTPKVMFATKQFSLEGVNAEAENWNDFGKWIYNDLIKDTHDLPTETVNFIKDLVKDENTNIEKAKKIYEYVQGKTRYISVQVGIGGWKPFNASYVDKVGYGDCKALTNYTMSLLKAAGVESNYTVVYAGNSQQNIEEDFVAMQGNHVILSIPNNDETFWLECTSQKVPFGFIGDFTDDRDVLVITPEGGKIKHTKKYNTIKNSQVIKGVILLSDVGNIDVNVTVGSKGIQYDDKYFRETEPVRDLDVHYKNRWKYINNISINKIDLGNNKDSIHFKETLHFTASNYAKLIGDIMLVNINTLNRAISIPDRYKDRKWPVKIMRGFLDVDEVEIRLPNNYKIESLPKNEIIENKFGHYKTEIVVKDAMTLVYKRHFLINDGEYPKEDYNVYREFLKEVGKLDNSKMALIKIQP